jgi:amino acid transporter
MGSLATYGFIVTYALVSIALPRYLKNHGLCRPGSRIIPWLACLAMVLALAGNLYPVPEGPYGKLPYIYLAYLAAGMLWFFWNTRRAALVERQDESLAPVAQPEAEEAE